MRILPALVPELRQRIDLVRIDRPDTHDVVR
jgi:hypothetical protein